MGLRFCTKIDCVYSSHRTKARGKVYMAPGFYVNDKLSQKAYLDPYLSLADGMCSQTGRSVLAGEDMTLEAWTAIFRHLQDTSVEVVDDSRGEGEAYFANTTDTGLQRFTTAMKTPRGRKAVNPLTELPAKRLSMGDELDDSSSVSSGADQGARVSALKNALALVMGELRSRYHDAPYVTVHGGLKGLWDTLESLEDNQ